VRAFLLGRLYRGGGSLTPNSLSITFMTKADKVYPRFAAASSYSCLRCSPISSLPKARLICVCDTGQLKHVMYALV